MKDPAVLFYTHDFLTGTMLMSDAQIGKYIKLLCLQHQNGKLSEKDMLKICGEFDADIWAKFQLEDGFFYNKRMLLETAKRNKFYARQKENISKRWNKSEYHGNTTVIPLENENEDINEDDSLKGGVGEKFADDVIELYNSVVILFDEKLRPKTAHQIFTWQDTLGKCMRLDGYTAEQLQAIIKRTRMDDFWRTNFLSVLKLRQTDKQGVKYVDVFAAKINGRAKQSFGIPEKQRDYTKPQTTF